MSRSIKSLLDQVVSGDAKAWLELQASIEPTITSFARHHSGLRRNGLAHDADSVREIVVSTLERFAKNEFLNLRQFIERVASQAEGVVAERFDSWIYGAVDFATLEYLRQVNGRGAPAESETGPRPRPRDLHQNAVPIDEVAGDRSLLQTISITKKLTAHAIFAYIDSEFTEDEARALRLYYGEGKDYPEIAAALGLNGEKAALDLIRRLNARLRNYFLD